MNRNNKQTALISLRARAKRLIGKVSSASALSMAVVGSALAQDMPTTVDEAAAFITTKGGIAIAVAGAITLIILGIAAAKMPRRGT